jgi:hypothetical protein
LIPNQVLPRVNNASGRRMPLKGVVVLVTQVGELVRRVRFYVVSTLSVPCILGCHFINTHVQGIFPREQRIDLREEGRSPYWADSRPVNPRRQRWPSQGHPTKSGSLVRLSFPLAPRPT